MKVQMIIVSENTWTSEIQEHKRYTYNINNYNKFEKIYNKWEYDSYEYSKIIETKYPVFSWVWCDINNGSPAEHRLLGKWLNKIN